MGVTKIADALERGGEQYRSSRAETQPSDVALLSNPGAFVKYSDSIALYSGEHGGFLAIQGLESCGVRPLRGNEAAVASSYAENCVFEVLPGNVVKASAASRVPSVVTYGSTVYLRHSSTNRFLGVWSSKQGILEKGSLRIAVRGRENLGKGMEDLLQFFVEPRYKIRKVGDLVRMGDPILLRNAKTRLYLHVSDGTFSDEHGAQFKGRHEVNNMADVSPWRVLPYAVHHTLFTSKGKSIEGGSVVTLYHRDSDSFLFAEDGIFNAAGGLRAAFGAATSAGRKIGTLQRRQTVALIANEAGMDLFCRPASYQNTVEPTTTPNGFWRIEFDRQDLSGVISRGDLVRIKQLNTLLYIALKDGRFVLESDPHDTATLFLLEPVNTTDIDMVFGAAVRIRHHISRRVLHIHQERTHTRNVFIPEAHRVEPRDHELFADCFVIKRVSGDETGNVFTVANLMFMFNTQLDALRAERELDRESADHLVRLVSDTAILLSEHPRNKDYVRDSRMVDLLFEVAAEIRKHYDEEHLHYDTNSHVLDATEKLQVLITQSIRGSKTNARYAVKFIDKVLEHHCEGHGMMDMFDGLVVDNDEVLNGITESQLDFIVGHMEEDRHHTWLTFLSKMCISSGKAVRRLQDMIIERLITSQSETGRVFMATQLFKQKNEVRVYSKKKWVPLDRFVAFGDPADISFFKASLDLLAHLAYDRHPIGSPEVAKIVTYDHAFAAVTNNDVPTEYRISYCKILTNAHLERFPNRRVPVIREAQSWDDTLEPRRPYDTSHLKEVPNMSPLCQYALDFLAHYGPQFNVGNFAMDGGLFTEMMRLVRHFGFYGYISSTSDCHVIIASLQRVLCLDGEAAEWQLDYLAEPLFCTAQLQACKLLDFVFSLRTGLQLDIAATYFRSRRGAISEDDTPASVQHIVDRMFDVLAAPIASEGLVESLLQLSACRKPVVSAAAWRLLQRQFSQAEEIHRATQRLQIFVADSNIRQYEALQTRTLELVGLTENRREIPVKNQPRVLELLQLLTDACVRGRDQSGNAAYDTRPDELHQNMLRHVRAHDAVVNIAKTVPMESLYERDGSEEYQIVRQAFRFVRAFCLENERNQLEMAPHVDFFQTLGGMRVDTTRALTEIYRDNAELSRTIRRSLVEDAVQRAGKHKDPKYLRFLRALVTDGRRGLRRNQAMVMEVLLQHSDSALVLFSDPDGKKLRAKLCSDGDLSKNPNGLLRYHVELVELMASCCASGPRRCLTAAEHLLPLDHVLETLVDPDLNYPVRTAFARLLDRVYIAPGRPVDHDLLGVLWYFLGNVAKDLGAYEVRVDSGGYLPHERAIEAAIERDEAAATSRAMGGGPIAPAVPHSDGDGAAGAEAPPDTVVSSAFVYRGVCDLLTSFFASHVHPAEPDAERRDVANRILDSLALLLEKALTYSERRTALADVLRTVVNQQIAFVQSFDRIAGLLELDERAGMETERVASRTAGADAEDRLTEAPLLKAIGRLADLFSAYVSDAELAGLGAFLRAPVCAPVRSSLIESLKRVHYTVSAPEPKAIRALSLMLDGATSDFEREMLQEELVECGACDLLVLLIRNENDEAHSEGLRLGIALLRGADRAASAHDGARDGAWASSDVAAAGTNSDEDAEFSQLDAAAAASGRSPDGEVGDAQAAPLRGARRAQRELTRLLTGSAATEDTYRTLALRLRLWTDEARARGSAALRALASSVDPEELADALGGAPGRRGLRNFDAHLGRVVPGAAGEPVGRPHAAAIAEARAAAGAAEAALGGATDEHTSSLHPALRAARRATYAEEQRAALARVMDSVGAGLVGGDDDDDDRAYNDAPLGDALELLQLLCCGHNRALQEYLRFQSNRLTSYDLVSAIVEHCVDLAPVVTEANAACVAQTLRTIRELVRGPHRANQAAVAAPARGAGRSGTGAGGGADLWAAVNFILRAPLTHVGDEAARDLKRSAVELLLALLEGVSPGAPIVQAMVSELEFDAIRALMDEPSWGRGASDWENLHFLLYVLISILADNVTAGERVAFSQFDSLAAMRRGREAFKKVQIVRTGALERAYFPVPAYAKYISPGDMRDILRSLDYTSHEAKLVQFVDAGEHVIHDAQRMLIKYRSVRNIALRESSWRTGCWVMAALYNVLLLFALRAGTGTAGTAGASTDVENSYEAPLIVSRAVCCALAVLMAIALFVRVVPRVARRHRARLAYGKQTWLSRAFARFAGSASAVLLDIHVLYRLLHPLFAAMTWYRDEYAAYLLVDIVFLAGRFRKIIRALQRQGGPLIAVGFLAVLMTLVFSTLGFYRYHSDFGASCRTLWQCALTMTHEGWTRPGGIGAANITQTSAVTGVFRPVWTDPFGDPFDGGPLSRIQYDLFFYACVTTFVFGVAVTATLVSAMRNLRQSEERERVANANRCFVSNIPRDRFDVHKLGSFESHIDSEQNKWHYLLFFAYLRSKDPAAMTSLELYVYDKLCKHDLSFMPVQRAMQLPEHDAIFEETPDERSLINAERETDRDSERLRRMFPRVDKAMHIITTLRKRLTT